jgi:hypothetical protein
VGSPLRLKYPLTTRGTTIRNAARNGTFKVKSSSMLQDGWERMGGRNNVGPWMRVSMSLTAILSPSRQLPYHVNG